MWVLISIGIIIFLLSIVIIFICALVWLAFWFERWSEKEADKNEKKKLDLQRALIAASDKNKKRR